MNHPGESIQYYTDRSGRWCDYRYQHTTGQKFQKISRRLKACRVARDKWIKNLEER